MTKPLTKEEKLELITSGEPFTYRGNLWKFNVLGILQHPSPENGSWMQCTLSEYLEEDVYQYKESEKYCPEKDIEEQERQFLEQNNCVGIDPIMVKELTVESKEIKVDEHCSHKIVRNIYAIPKCWILDEANKLQQKAKKLQ